LVLLTVLCVGSPGSVAAASNADPAASLDASDPDAVRTFFDQLLPAQLAAHDVPGATVSVVKDGTVVLQKGYGFADSLDRRAVVADETRFGVGSLTKLFTWTAVMQLVERGKIDVEADVNGYLDAFQVPATFPEPITVGDLMTHTAGFEERQLGISVLKREDRDELAAYLAAEMPARIFAPGEVTAYSNYGAALAGHIVEQVSGEPFERYVQEHVLAPLGMSHTTVGDVTTTALGERAVSYRSVNGDVEALPEEYFQITPASGMTSTAADVARFMIAHLEGGTYGNASILGARAMDDLHRRHFANDPRLSGMTYGFAETLLGEERLIHHRGSTNFEQFESALYLVPDRRLGLFVSFNGEGGSAAKGAVAEAFLGNVLPQAAPAAPRAVDGAEERARRFAGSYRSTRTTESNIEKLAALITPTVNVVANDDGTLSISGGPVGDMDVRWVEVEPLLFRPTEGTEKIAFAMNDTGEITSLFVDSLPIVGFTKQSAWASTRLHVLLMVLCVVIFLSAVVALPVAMIRDRRKGIVRTRQERTIRAVAWLTSFAFVSLPPSFVAGMANLEAGVGRTAQAALVLGSVASIFGVALIGLTAIAWRRDLWGLPARVHVTVVTMAAVVLPWSLNYWNLLGVRL
jgi:CubicO group peptidase (beta-lactamase class C family)